MQPIINLLKYGKKSNLYLILLIIIAAASACLAGSRISLWGEAIDFVTANDKESCSTVIIASIIILIIEAIITIFEGGVIGLAFDRLFYNIRKKTFDHLLKIDLQKLDENIGRGELITKMTINVEQLCDLCTSNFTWFARVILLGIVSLGLCVFSCWQLSVLFFVIIPIFIHLVNRVSKNIKVKQTTILSHIGDSVNVALKMIDGIHTIKAYNAEKEVYHKYCVSVDSAQSDNKKLEKTSLLLTGVKYLISILQIFLLFFLGYLFIKGNLITFGEFVAFVTLSESVRALLELIPTIASKVRSASALAQGISSILDSPMEEEFELSGKKNIPGDDNVAIEMKNLTFSYNGMTEKALDHVNMILPCKKHVGIIGASGSGKSTIINLICKFYKDTTDSIYWNGSSINQLDAKFIREKISIVTQSPLLFNASIYENVQYGRMDATRDEIIVALKKAQLWDEVNALEKGMDTNIGEKGKYLSGGQRQRLSLARAFLKNAPFVILDEATSALDSALDNLIQISLEELLRNKSALIISHKFSDLKTIDYLYCLQNGKIIEQGVPSELYEEKGYFYDAMLQQEKSDWGGGSK